MLEKYQFLVAALIPSVLVILSWIHNNTRLSRLEAGLDVTNRRMETIQEATNRRMEAIQEATNRRIDDIRDALNRRIDELQESFGRKIDQIQEINVRKMDELVRGFHSDMMGFQASILESNFQLRERVAIVEAKQQG